MRFSQTLLLLLAACPVWAADLDKTPLKAFLEANCQSCHNADVKKGNLNLDSLSAKLDEQLTAERWVKLHDRVQRGEMPPMTVKTRPKPEEAKAFIDALGKQLAASELAARKESGRTTLRRLNRTEYENTLRDLFQLPLLQVKDLLPDDGRVDGFDKGANALDISPILMDKFAEAADHALDQAIAQYAVPPVPAKLRMYANEMYDFGVVIPNGDGVMLKNFKYDDSRFPIPKDSYAGGKFKGLGELEQSGLWRDKPGTAGLFRCLGESFPGRFNRFSPNFPGHYRVTTSVWSFWWDKGEVLPSPRSGAAGIYYGSRALGFFDAPSLKPTTHQIDAWLEPDDYLKFDPASLWEVHPYSHKDKAAGYTGPAVAIDFMEIEGPLNEEWPPASHKRLFGDLPMIPLAKLPADAPKPKRSVPRRVKTYDAGNSPGALVFATVNPAAPAAEAERLLTDFLPRAFRRPVKSGEIARYSVLVMQRLATGACFEDAMRTAYKAVLCSPDFLFLKEPVGPLDDYAVASRLSYFLWNSSPDETLMKLAAEGKLRDPKIVREQSQRMLNDPKAERFVADFLDQWLDLKDFNQTTPDRGLYPEFQPYLADALRQEPKRFFAELLKNNDSAAKLIDSDFLMVNQRLAEHYGIPGVTGTQFRRIGVPKESHRGGILTQGAVLKVTANGTTTSPVKRGAWVMRKFLGLPPDPPPPDISAIEPDVRGTTTVRELLAKHRDNASCAACHAKMDPPGFALESFDVIGGLRDRYRATQGKDLPVYEKMFVSHLNPAGKFPTNYYHVGFRQGPAVDAAGETVTHEKFNDIDGFKKLLLNDTRLVARNLERQLATYATGAPVGFADRPQIEGMLDRAGGNFPLRNLIGELVQSELFLNK
ncbi:DUF1592 domain-containing protein [Zavarzinella formosa]|uniref:DUF1592 domain-containing protein n=1 Tax=Zavarzinella formosa TaxID=360055 RepID=UPI0002F0B325|nr:DUF1592 domain-containing protein [Zavarzinella formosa]